MKEYGEFEQVKTETLLIFSTTISNSLSISTYFPDSLTAQSGN